MSRSKGDASAPVRPQPEEKSRSRFWGQFQGRTFRLGGYSMLLIAGVLALVIAINALVGRLPASLTKPDMTASQLFSISERTEELVSALSSDVNMYLIANTGKEDNVIVELLDRYRDLSRHISVTFVDPAVSPNFTSQYTDETVPANSVIVTCGSLYKYVPYDDIYVHDYSKYIYTYEAGDISISFDGEAALTSAISYVVSGYKPQIYMLGGHGEYGLPSGFKDGLLGENMELSDLSLLTKEAVPEDCDLLVINDPSADISQEEADKILSYLEGGGNMLLLSSYSSLDRPHLLAVMEHYGCTASPGLVIEGDGDHCIYGYYHYLLPDIAEHDITAPLLKAGYNVLMPVAEGIVVREQLREGLGVTKLLTTSDASFAKLDGLAMSSYEKEAGDLDGPFVLGVAISEGAGEEETRIVWYSTAYMTNGDVDTMVSGANKDLFLNSVAWMTDLANSISIRSKSLETTYLTMTSGESARLSIIFIGVLPALFLAAGIFVVVRRRRR